MMGRRVIVWLLVIAIVGLSGCADHKQLEQLAHVVVIGLDEANDGFIEVTFQIANPQVGSTDIGQSETEPASDIVSIVATDLLTARELANTIISRRVSFTHLQVMIVSEQLARRREFHEIFASQVRQPQLRREMNLIVCREKAAEFIKKNRPKLETRPHKYYEFMLRQWQQSGVVPISTMNRYLQRLSGGLFLATYATTERIITPKQKKESEYRPGEVPSEAADPVQMIGSAVFKEGRMVGTFTGEETRLTLMMRGPERTHSHIDSFPDPLEAGERVTVRLMRNQRTRVDIDVSSDEAPKIRVTIPLTVRLLSIQGLVNYVTDLQKQRLLEQAIEQSLEDDAMRLIKRTQEEFGSEPFKWYLQARKKFWTWQEYMDYDWDGKYPRADVNVEFQIRLESFGKQYAPERVHVTKD